MVSKPVVTSSAMNPKFLGEDILWQMVNESSPGAEPMITGRAQWEDVLSRTEYVPVGYTPSMVAYQGAYMRAKAEVFRNLSVVLRHGNLPVAVWPLSVTCSEGIWSCGSNEGAVLPPLFISGVGERTKKVIVEQCLSLLNILCRRTGQTEWKGVESVRDYGLSLWHRKLMEQGATVRPAHELYVDLSLGLDEIKANLRKSYKPLLTKGHRLWQVEVLDSVKPGTFTEYRTLHLRVAGRVTRSLETWEIQECAINDNSAFLVVLRDQNGTMVGGGLFHVSQTEGLYAVGAYDRNLFELPLGHVVQMRAIEHMKRLGLRWYKIGARPYAGTCSSATEKELSIAHFKEGFTTHFFLQLQTSSPVHA